LVVTGSSSNPPSRKDTSCFDIDRRRCKSSTTLLDMPDYGKKTVADLTEILKRRSLPHTGKKADLVARLNEADKSDEAKKSTHPVF
jgi:SAP domain